MGILTRAGLVQRDASNRYSARREGIAPLIAWVNAYGNFLQVARGLFEGLGMVTAPWARRERAN